MRVGRAQLQPVVGRKGELVAFEWDLFGSGRKAAPARLSEYRRMWKEERERRHELSRRPITAASRLTGAHISLSIDPATGMLAAGFTYQTDRGRVVSVETHGYGRLTEPTPAVPRGAVPTVQVAYRAYAWRTAFNQVTGAAMLVQRAVRLRLARRMLAVFRTWNVVNLSVVTRRPAEDAEGGAAADAGSRRASFWI